MKLYLKYRKAVGAHKGNLYTPSFYFNVMFKDKLDYITMLDNEVPESMYLTPKQFAIVEFDDTKISKEDLEYDLRDLPNHIRVAADVTEAISMLDEYTSDDLVNKGNGLFEFTELNDAGEEEINSIIIE